MIPICFEPWPDEHEEHVLQAPNQFEQSVFRGLALSIS